MNGLDLSLKNNDGDRHTFLPPSNIELADAVGMY